MSGRESPPPAKSQGSASPQKTFRVADLVGCEVFTPQGELLGHLFDVLPTGGNDVYVVRHGSRETLIPATRRVVVEINLSLKRITVELPPGLREIYDNA